MAAVAKAPVCHDLKFYKSVGSNPVGTKNIFIFWGNFFFYFYFLSFFTCIELFKPWGMFTNYVDMKKGGEVLNVSIINNLAQCALCTTDLVL